MVPAPKQSNAPITWTMNTELSWKFATIDSPADDRRPKIKAQRFQLGKLAGKLKALVHSLTWEYLIYIMKHTVT